MIEIRAKINAASALRAMAGLARKEIPFATALALTNVAKLATDKVRADLGHEFTVRRPWTAGGIRFDMAKKRDWPKISARVGSIDPYMVDFEAGGPHTTEGTRKSGPRTGVTTAFVIPVNIRRAAGIQSTQVIPTRLWPASVRKEVRKVRGRKGRRVKPQPFLHQLPDGRMGVFVRDGQFGSTPAQGSRRGTRGRERLTLLWAIAGRPSRAPAKHWLSKPSQSVMSASLAKEFDKALKKAMATSK